MTKYIYTPLAMFVVFFIGVIVGIILADDTDVQNTKPTDR